jgi:hypothetical protein
MPQFKAFRAQVDAGVLTVTLSSRVPLQIFLARMWIWPEFHSF